MLGLSKLKEKFKGFTLVELLAVIAILAIILLIAVPMILGVIEDARKDSFRNSVRGAFHAAELKVAIGEGITDNGEMQISDLDLSGEKLEGTWTITNGKIIFNKVSNGTYCVSDVTEESLEEDFAVSNSGCETLPKIIDASEVEYTPSDTNITATTVEEALNDLYSKR